MASNTQCDGCNAKFSWLRKRRTCLMCRSVCCWACMQRARYCSVGRHCLRCVRLGGVRYEGSVLRQMTVRDLKHIMKILDISSATCREKSDLVDKIMMCYQSGQPADAAPPAAPTPAPAAAPCPRRGRPRDSIRVGPYDSIRVRPVDGPEQSAEPKRPPEPHVSGDAGRPPADDPGALPPHPSDPKQRISEPQPRSSEPQLRYSPVLVEVDDDDCVLVSHRPAAGEAVRTAVRPADDSDDADSDDDDVGELIVVDDYPAALSRTGAPVAADADADDRDEPESESTAIEVEPEAPPAEGETAVEEIDLSTLEDVAQLPSEELIDRLTVRQCKRLLQHRRTEYRDVIEKEELLRRVRLLWRETRRNLDALATASDNDICKICMDSLVDCVMLECGHMATCTACGKQMAECPICRKYVVRVVHVFRS